jgi:hypothetical protein
MLKKAVCEYDLATQLTLAILGLFAEKGWSSNVPSCESKSSGDPYSRLQI